MKTTHLVAFIALLSLSASCKKELDLLPDAWFGVREFLKSGNSHAACGEVADCEGQTVGLEGLIDESNVNPETLQFYLLDEKKESFKMEVRVAPEIAVEVFQKLRYRLSNEARVRGEIEGYDQPMNGSCQRGFSLRLSSVSDLVVLE